MKIHALFLYCSLLIMTQNGFAADEIHWTITGQTSVTFDWRGTNVEDSIRYGQLPGTYVNEVFATPPNPLPSSSPGPFWEAKIAGLQADTLYYYSIANGPEHTFRTPPLPGDSDFYVYVEGDIGSTHTYSEVAGVQNIIGNAYLNGLPDFTLVVGDLSYGDINGIIDVDQHFNDVMLWSQDAAYMPAWGNHEWHTTANVDQFNNYKGRFDFANPQTSPGTASIINNTIGEDWSWFDYGNVRFISFPEPYPGAWADWNTQVQGVMADAQNNPNITFIATFGHQPAYSSNTAGNSVLKGYLDGLAFRYSKYVLNLNGHHHDYERSDPTQTNGVTHVIAGTGHTKPAAITTTQPSWSAFRTRQPGALKLHFTSTHIDGEFICAPTGTVCPAAGTVLDSFTVNLPVVDTIPPTVSLTAPADGTTVSGAVLVTATASDNVRVAGVQFKHDGVNLGNEITTAPFSISWDTTTLINGTHTLTAVARDAAGNVTTSSPISVTLNNSAPPDIDANLTHKWKFDETSGPTALDSIGANTATLSNSLWVAGKAGNAASFNGTNAAGTAGMVDFGTGNFTVAHWVKVTAFKNFAGIFNNRSSTGTNLGFQTRTDGTGSLTALIDFGATSKNVAVTNAVTGAWYHMAVTVDRAGLMKLYVNGALAGQVSISAFSGTSVTNSDSVRIGRDQSSASSYYNGVIDDLRLYGTVLSATDILNIYNATSDATAPTVGISAPANGGILSGSTTVSATASDNIGVVGVQFKLDGNNLAVEDTSAPYSITWDTSTVANVSHTLTAVARDAVGNTTTSSPVSVTVNNVIADVTPPVVGITDPTNGDNVSGFVHVSADASDDASGVVGVQFKLDGNNLATEDTSAPYSITWDTSTVAIGSHTLTAVARDAAGNVATSGSVAVTVSSAPPPDTIAPNVILTAPVANAIVSGLTDVSAAATDNVGVVGVQFKLDGNPLGAEITGSGPFALAWDTTTATAGGHSLTAVARDAAGNSTTSAPVSVTVNNTVSDTTPPTVSMTAPAANAIVSGTISVSANATDNVGVVGVQFKLDGNSLSTEITAAPFSTSWNTTTIANGVHTLTAVARDAAGNVATSSAVSVTVNNPIANLTHNWKFDETSGTTALDSIGTNTATLSSSLWVVGHAGNAASFNGTNASSGTAGTIDFGTGNFTVSHWVKVTAFKNFAGIFNNRSSIGTNLGFQTRTDGTSTLTALIDFGATSKSVAVTTALTGTWYHIAVSVDRAGLMKLYVNGAFVGQVSISAFSTTSITNSDSVRIGRDQSATSNYYNGAVDELRIYNSALSAAEILNIFNE
jgi:Concanavalin A-like lectin/glucanases superfamily/Bacterial Ig domain